MTRLIVLLGSVVFLALIAVVYFELGYIRFNYPDESKYPVHGIDISHHQDVIDWDVLQRSDIRFAFIKATEGGDHKDTKFEQNWERAGDIGLIRGAYHFFTFCKSGREQALNYIDSVPFENNTLPPAIDLEFSGNCQARPTKEEVHQELSVFAKMVELKYGKRPIIYTTNKSYNAFIAGENLGYPVWIRDIYRKPGLKDRSPWTFWQYTHKGRLYGIDGFVDLNVFNGSTEEFLEFVSSGVR